MSLFTKAACLPVTDAGVKYSRNSNGYFVPRFAKQRRLTKLWNVMVWLHLVLDKLTYLDIHDWRRLAVICFCCKESGAGGTRSRRMLQVYTCFCRYAKLTHLTVQLLNIVYNLVSYNFWPFF